MYFTVIIALAYLYIILIQEATIYVNKYRRMILFFQPMIRCCSRPILIRIICHKG